jgi:amino acid adenylation domain-containing protein
MNLPLSFAQERLWFLDRLSPGLAVYNQPLGLALAGPLAVPAWRRSLWEIARRHEVLRTSFPEVDGRPVQRIAPAGEVPVPVADLSGLPDAMRQREADRLTTGFARRPFDLATGPLFRAALLRLGTPGTPATEEWVALLNLHHTIADGASLALLLGELAALYPEIVGRPAPLPELALQYSDYAVWQRQRLTGEALAPQLSGWRRELAGLPELLPLPTDRPRPAVQSFRGGRRLGALPPGATAELARLGRERGATLFMVLLAAWEALLHRLTGATDLAVGSPVDTRDRTELEGLIGLFVNTLVLRGRISGDEPFPDLLARTRETAVAAYARQELPFEILVSELPARTDLGRNPLFQVMLAFQHEGTAPPRLPGLRARLLDLDLGGSRVDLGLAIEGVAGGLTLALEHSADLFDSPTSGRFLGGYLTLLAGVAGMAGLAGMAKIGELPLLDASERHQLLHEWNAREPSDRGEPSEPVHQRFARQAEITPDAVALVAGVAGIAEEAALTYAELDRRAGRLARRLRLLGAGPETRVGLLAERSADLVIGWLGIWKAGAAVLPLDPAQPDARLARFLADEPILTQPGLAARAAALAAPGAAIVLLEEPLREEPADPETGWEGYPANARAGDLAYLIFTSGTTGRPKGVMVEHGSLAHTLAACRAAFGPDAADRLPVLASAGFDIFLFELLLPLLEGATAVLCERQPTLDTAALAARLPGMTLLHAVPALMRQIVAEVARTQGTCRSLRRVFVGGDAVPGDLLAALRHTFPAARVTVLYGPTEGTILAAAWEVAGEIPAERKPLGRPLPGVDLTLHDPRGEPAPIGLPGELWIGGPGVARGYLGRPERTAASFVPSPGAGKSRGERAYRTGDLARLIPSGRLEFLGRIDQQLKVRGYRVEPGEVEAALRSHPAVREAAVVAREEGSGGPRLAAFLVAEPERAIALPEMAEIAAYARQRLPVPMVPVLWAVLPALPLTAHGKVDRRALAGIEAAVMSPSGTPGDASPETPTEELLAGIWAGLLGAERVGRHDSFFDLGGHSLLAIQAISRVRDELGVELPVRALFESPTPALLAREVERARSVATAGSEPAAPLVPVGRDRPLPLSFAQERLWLLDQLQPGSAYNLPFSFDLVGSLDLAAWAATWAEVVRRHEALRTHFRPAALTDGGAVQEIAPPDTSALPQVDLTRLPESPRRAEAARLAAAEARRPFDLAAGPLVRTLLLRLTAEEHREILNLHHAVADAWSLGVLLAELQGIYGAFAARQPSPLPPLPIQYADYAVWQRSWLRGAVLARQLAYWRDRLSGERPGDRPLALPVDHPEREGHGHPGAVLRTSLPAGLGRALLARGREQGATFFMTLFAGFAALLGRFADDAPDVTLGTPIANRGRAEVSGLIGFFVNTLALRVRLAGDPGFTGLLGRVREAALGAYDHQDLPFEKLVRELRPERRPDENPLFETAFSLNRPLPGFTLPGKAAGAGLTLTPGEIHPGTAKFRLALAVTETPGGLTAAWDYRADLFDAPTIARLARAWEVLLAGLAAEPERPWSQVPLLAEGERHQVAREWNDTASPYPRDATLPEIFARQVARSRQAVALSAGGAALTYGELDRRAEALAHHLVALGVGPEMPVALALPRGFDLIVGILGILKAGGAYVPLDPEHPAERLGFVLEDTGVKVVLTHGDLAERLPLSGQQVVELDLLSAAGAVGEVRPGSTADNLAYVLYTSGSTGVPKGVAVTNRNVLRLVLGTGYARFGPVEVFLQLAPVSFDASTFEIWGALLHGGRLVLAPPGRVSLREIARAIEEGGVTTLWLTAGLFHQMVDEELPALAGVRQLLAGGDVVAPERARAALVGLPGTVLIDGYGPTEGTTFSCCESLADPAEIGDTIPIGRPIANARAHVLDRALGVVPVGVAGELYLGGGGLARGYLGRSDWTAERFVPDPLGLERTGGRLYQTGDRARLRPDGRLDFLGRTDLQVKVAGHRVEPGEIEAVLARHPGVRESAVVAQPAGETSSRRLVAYVVPAEGVAVGEAELRAWLRARLPEPLLPRRFVLLDRLPLTANGKVDRAALPLPGPGGFGEATGEAAAGALSTPTAEILAGLWADLLDLPRVDPGADFFALGGHSLLGIHLVAQIRRTFAVDLPLRALFEAPTVAAFSRRIDDCRRAGGTAAGPDFPRLPVPPTGEVEVHPLSLAQRRLWFVDRLRPGGFFLNVPHGLRLSGDLAPDLLERSLGEIVARHEPLRATFTTVDGQPAERIAPPDPFRPFQLPLADLSALPAAHREGAAQAAGQALAEHPADLARGPLFRAALLRLAPTEHQLLLVPHHLVFDGVSRGVLFHELETLYGALARGLLPRLPALPVRYAEFALWQREAFASSGFATERAWWRERLAGLPALDLPADHPRPPVQRFGGGFRTRALPAALAADLLALCRRQGVTLFMALLALFETLLARWSGQTDFPLGVPVAGRDYPEISGLIGFFVNTLVLRADLAGEPTFADLLARTRRTALDAYAHQDLPFEILVDELRPERHLDANPLFDVALSLDEPPRLPDLPGLEVAPLDLAGDAAHFDLLLIATRPAALAASAAALTLTLNYRHDLYEAATAERLLEQLASLLERALERAVTAPETPALDLSPWSAAAWQQVTREWNDTTAAESVPRTAYERFAEQARQAPEALALAGPGGRFTYGELDRQANGLAWRLRQLGVGAGGTGRWRVALGFDRSPELVLAALATWKAGAAYLPLDPAAPPERLAFLVADAGASLVLTRRDGAERFAGCAVPTLFVDEETVESAAPPRRGAPRAGEIAYVIYTSGSTGRPKGVEVSHGALANLVAWALPRFLLTASDRSSLVTSPAFDASVWDLWVNLSAGASLHAPPRGIAVSPRELLAWFAAERLTTAFLPTPLAEGVLHQERPAGLILRHLFAGGDRLRQAPPAGWELTLVNAYGPTECTVITTTTELLPEAPGTPSIGRPIGGAEVYLLDSALRPVPPGGRGEVAIGGAGLARGYTGRPERTAEHFVPHPFSSRPGARLYRTGDLARYRANGEIEFLGRAGGQVKVRGFRVEMGEIEVQLGRHPALRESVVVRRDDPALGTTLVAYVVPASPADGAPSGPELRRFLAARLPEYMLPAAFVPLPALPLNVNGKVDRRALPREWNTETAAGGGEAAAGGGEEAAASELERTIARLWCEVLHLGAVSARDNFFELGGQSLAMVAVHEKLQAALGIEFPLVEMFESPTTRTLAARLTRRTEERAEQQDFNRRAARQRRATGWKEQARKARRPKP